MGQEAFLSAEQVEWAANPDRENPSYLQYNTIQGQVNTLLSGYFLKEFLNGFQWETPGGKYRDYLYFYY